MEARTRDGAREGGAPPSIYQQAATLNRDKSLSRSRLSMTRGRSMEKMTREVEISQDDDEDEMVRAPLSREEERRKRRREEEIKGLQQALSILENETAFMQHK